MGQEAPPPRSAPLPRPSCPAAPAPCPAERAGVQLPPAGGRRGRENRPPWGCKSLSLDAGAALRTPSEDDGPHDLGRAPDHGGQALLRRSGGLRGGCDHLPAGHSQSPAPGSQRDWGGGRADSCRGRCSRSGFSITARSQVGRAGGHLQNQSGLTACMRVDTGTSPRLTEEPQGTQRMASTRTTAKPPRVRVHGMS